MRSLALALFSTLFLAGCHQKNQKNEDIPPIDAPKVYRYQSEVRLLSSRISDETRLRKLSIHLRGFPPSEVEFQALNDAKKAGKLTDFWPTITKTYLSSQEHVAKMIERLDELFRLRATSGLIESRF